MNTSYSEDPRMPDDAFSQLVDCLEDAKSAGEKEIMLMSVATCGLDAKPSVRYILAADINEYGVSFFTNKNSGKGIQLSENPQVSICFYWNTLGQQLIIEGKAIATSLAEADTLWRKRDRTKQIAAWASNQSEHSRGANSHKERLSKTRESFGYDEVPLPENWIAYRVVPSRIEFWRAGWRNIKDRIAYELHGDEWKRITYEP